MKHRFFEKCGVFSKSGEARRSVAKCGELWNPFPIKFENV